MGGTGLIPGWGTKTLHAAEYAPPKNPVSEKYNKIRYACINILCIKYTHVKKIKSFNVKEFNGFNVLSYYPQTQKS